jgi:aminoglycoside phosphotransferase (APT) family kinase protein
MPLSVLSISENLTKYFTEKFPKRRENKISEVTSLAKGWETELFSFVYSSKEGSEDIEQNLILRIYPGSNLEGKIKWEFEVLVTLFAAGYPVPKTHILELNTEYFGYPFIIMDTIIGSDMGESFELDIYNNLRILCKLFVNLHNLDWRILTTIIDKDDSLKPVDLINERIKKIEGILDKYKIQELNPLIQWLKTNKDGIEFERISILHNDFHPHNVIISEEGNPYVIDWPACSIGDYRQDLGWTLLLSGAYSSRDVRDLVLRSYENALGSKVENIEYFEILAATRRIMDMFLFFGQSIEDAGIREETLQQIKETVFHLEYISSFVKEVTGIIIQKFDELIQSLLIK